MSTQVLIYPIFVECSEYTLDPFWKDIFHNCACNRFPRGLSYDSKSNSLRIRLTVTGGRTKNEVIALPEGPIPEIFQVMMYIFKEKLGLKSSRDLQIQVQELEEIKEQNRINLECEWKKLKPRSLRDELIMNFVVSLGEKYSLSDKEKASLLKTIQLGFQYKKITADHVDYQNGVIRNISGLEYEPENRKFNITNESRTISKNEKSTQTRRFNQSLDRFIRDYKAKRIKAL